MKNALKIAILTEKTTFIPRWSYEMLATIIKDKTAELTLHIQCVNPPLKQPYPARDYATSNFNNRFFNWTQRRHFKRFLSNKNNAFELIAFDNLAQPDILEVQAEMSHDTDGLYLKDSSSKLVEDIDLVINLTQQEIHGAILEKPTFGLWSFIFGDASYSGSLPIFWQMYEGEGYSAVALRMTKDNQSTVLYSSTSLIETKSPIYNLNKIYWKIQAVIPLKLAEIQKLGEASFLENLKVNKPIESFLFEQRSEVPSNLKLLRMMITRGAKRIANKITSTFYLRQWILLYNISDEQGVALNLNNFVKMVPPKDRIWADPHILERNDTFYIFIEELIYQENKGFISVIVMDKAGNYSAPTKVLETDYHLSYPFLIEDRGELYMIPETKETNNIQLFKCVEFPTKWKLEKVLMEGVEAADTTVIKKDNKFWLFTNIVKHKNGTKHDELFLYYSDELVSDAWTSHPENPIVTDVRNARPAGSFFDDNQKTYRPSQNCAIFYGYGLQLNELLVLNEKHYLEKIVKTINPDWDKNILATHSFARLNELTVIDARLKRRRKIL